MHAQPRAGCRGGGILTAEPNEQVGVTHSFSVKLSGKAEISGNKSAKTVKTTGETEVEIKDEKDNNLYLYKGAEQNAVITVVGKLTGKVGVTLAESYGDTAFSAGYGAANTPAEPAKLSGEAIAGITIGCVVVVVAALYVTDLVLYKKNIIAWKICKILYFFIM